jgi:hypothetical protein
MTTQLKSKNKHTHPPSPPPPLVYLEGFVRVELLAKLAMRVFCTMRRGGGGDEEKVQSTIRLGIS